MDTLMGYRVVEEIFRSRRTIVYRSEHVETGVAAILKVVRERRPSRERVLWLKREFELLRGLGDVEGTVRALELGLDQGLWVMALEDFGGQDLESVLQDGPLGLEEGLEVAARIAVILGRVHAAGVIHKDINPANIALNRATGEVRLIDFGIATELRREVPRFETPRALQGTLAYISPEQTGRMNRSVDHRTDLYSLGATLYQLFSGRVPFAGADAIALVHAHLARDPPPLAEGADEIPEAVSNIVSRLMAKAPEDRYRSAEGLAQDLEECLRQLRGRGEVQTFALDQSGGPSGLVLPERLYGRQEETGQLVAAFERAATGSTQLVLVTGHSGIGKTALVQQAYAPITARNGFFVSGKFDQLQRDVPYAAVTQAVTDLTRQVLTASQERLDRWRSELVEALAPNAQLLLDLIPALEHVVGPQPPVPELSASESRHLQQVLFTRFLQTFARQAHPVTLFLDDLQWIDAASLTLLLDILASEEVAHLLVIGAYRDDEVAAGHPLLLGVDELKRASVPVATIALGPLGLEHVAEFLADMTLRDRADVAELAVQVVEKTSGNPFFVREFCAALYAQGLFQLVDGSWRWDADAIDSVGITDNVVQLVTRRLEALDTDTQTVLHRAGVLGNRFDVETLAVAADMPIAEAWKALRPALEGGFVLPLNSAYKLLGLESTAGDEGPIRVPLRFVHDRVQQAAHALEDDDANARASWNIGKRLAARWPATPTSERLFDIVGHLNAGRANARSQAERDQLASLNLIAAGRARSASAFGSAYDHARVGLELLGETGEERRYELAMALLTECVEAAYLSGDFEGMDIWHARAVSAAKDVLDVAWVQEIKTEAFNARGRPLEALDHALSYLHTLGVDCPREPTMDDVAAEMKAAGELAAAHSPDQLAAAPDMQDPAIAVAVGLICKIYSSAYVASPLVFAFVCLRQFRLVVEHGNCKVSALSYAVYGLLMAAFTNDVEQAYVFGELSDRMLDRPDIKRFEAQARHLFSCHTRMWKEHLRDCAEGERRAYRIGLDTGELEFGCYGAHVAAKYALFCGDDLEALRHEMEQYSHAMTRYRQDLPRNSHLPWHQAVVNLTQKGGTPHRLEGAVLDAPAARPALEAAKDRMAISNALTAQLLLCVVFGRFAEAVEVGEDGLGYLDAAVSQFNQPLHLFLDALARLTWWHQAPEEARGQLRVGAETALESLRGWAASNPANFAQKVALLEAEILVLDADTAGARQRFDAAIRLSQQHEFLLDECLACEAAARFLRRQDNLASARHYEQDAHHAYGRWGATAKVAQMEAADPGLLRTPRPTLTGLASTFSVTGGTAGVGDVDIVSLFKAAEAIASEVVLSRLLRRLLSTLIENVGAERAVLILIEDDVARIEGTASAEGDIEVLMGRPLFAAGGTSDHGLPLSLYNLAVRSGLPVLAADASQDARFARDPYLHRTSTRSALCVPIRRQGRTSGAIYFENNRAAGVFTPERTELVRLLAGQIAISIDNARLVADLEGKVRVRTRDLERANAELTTSIEKIQAMQQQIIVQEKLASLGSLTGGIAHELQNPLNFVNNFSEGSQDLLEEALELADALEGTDPASVEELQTLLREVSDSNGAVQRHGSRAASIIRAMVAHTQAASSERQPCQLNELVETAAHVARASASDGQSIALTMDLDEAVGLVTVGEADIHRVVLNLVDNALHAVSRRETEGAGNVRVSTHAADGEVVIRVRDNGHGIPPEVLPQIFEPFFSTRPSGQGTGLGLSLAHDIVVQGHQGSLSVVSEAGEFTEFTVRLPS